MEELFKDPVICYLVILLAFVLGQATMFAFEVVSYKRAEIEISKIDFNNPNQVHFYITADKNPTQFKLWLGKPRKSKFSECWLPSDKISVLLAETKEDIEYYGLKPSDYNFVTWESGAIEVFLNLD